MYEQDNIGGFSMTKNNYLDAVKKHELNFSSFSAYRNAIYGFAALWIVVFHGVELKNITFLPSMPFLEKTIGSGNIGVDIFVLLSGVGLYFSFSKGPKLLSFYKNRIVRVYIPYIMMALPYFIYLYAQKQMDIGLFIKNILTINFWTDESTPISFWYVSAILVFYIVYPLIHKFIFHGADLKISDKFTISQEKRELIRCMILVVVSIVIGALIFYKSPETYKVIDKVPSRFTAFIIGCYLGKFVKEGKRFSSTTLIIAAFIVGGMYPLYAGRILKGIWLRYYGSLTGIALVFILSQLFIVLSRINIDKIMAFFGTISLEIYMLHIIARRIFVTTPLYNNHAFRNYMIFGVIAIIAAILVGLLEKPIFKILLKKKSTEKRKHLK